MKLTEKPWRQGFVVGLITYTTVAVFYGVFDLIGDRGMFFTVDQLGRALFGQIPVPPEIQATHRVDISLILAYNALHFVLSVVAGLIIVRLVDFAQWRPQFGLLVLAVIVTGFALTVMAVGLLSVETRPLLPWWSIVVVNGIASIVGMAYLLIVRPGLWHSLIGDRESDDERRPDSSRTPRAR